MMHVMYQEKQMLSIYRTSGTETMYRMFNETFAKQTSINDAETQRKLRGTGNK